MYVKHVYSDIICFKNYLESSKTDIKVFVQMGLQQTEHTLHFLQSSHLLLIA